MNKLLLYKQLASGYGPPCGLWMKTMLEVRIPPLPLFLPNVRLGKRTMVSAHNHKHVLYFCSKRRLGGISCRCHRGSCEAASDSWPSAKRAG